MRIDENGRGAGEDPRLVSLTELAAITGRSESSLRVAGRNGLFKVSQGRVDLAKAVRAIMKDHADRTEARAVERVKKSKKIHRRVALLQEEEDASREFALELAQLSHELASALAEVEAGLPAIVKARQGHLLLLVRRLRALSAPRG